MGSLSLAAFKFVLREDFEEFMVWVVIWQLQE